MADTFTTHYNLTKPEVGASPDTWGNKLNADLDAIDTAIKNAADDAAAALAQAGAALPMAGGTMTGNISAGVDDWRLQSDTTDGSDTRRISLCAGGAPSNSRGAYLQLHGNEHATNPGEAVIASGAGYDTILQGAAIRASTPALYVNASSAPVDLYLQIAGADVCGVYSSAAVTALWSTLGSLRFRPNGRADTTGQMVLSAGGNLSVAGTLSDSIGDVRRALVNVQNANYTIALTDLCKVVRKTNSSAIAYTIDPESTTPYGGGFIFTVRNFSASGNITVTRGSGVALRIAGSSVDQNVTVAPWGQATFVREATNVWSATGTGIS